MRRRWMGLSPRVRGSQSSTSPTTPVTRSIPASAGQPITSCDSRLAAMVYPRECGAAPGSGVDTTTITGLSPRVRGSPRPVEIAIVVAGSIPASAGQPPTSRPENEGPAVYPRECGAAELGPRVRDRTLGLSPRVRGSPQKASADHGRTGSIPASAGQPHG